MIYGLYFVHIVLVFFVQPAMPAIDNQVNTCIKCGRMIPEIQKQLNNYTTPEIAKRPQGDIRAKRQVEPLKLKIRIKGHFRRRSKAAYKFGDIDQHITNTIMASNFFADTFNKVKTPITEISWHKYVAGPPEEKIPGSCPGVAINRKFLLTSKSCHDAIEVNETVKSFVWYDKFFNGKIVQIFPIIGNATTTTTTPTTPDPFERFVFKKEYNFPSNKTDIDLIMLESVFPLFQDGKTPRPLCLSEEFIQSSLIGFRLLWFFWKYPEIGTKVTAFVTIAKVLDPKNDPRCQDAKNNDNLICVILENDLDQCTETETENGGYLAIFKDKVLTLIGIYSHGESDCRYAKEIVAFFTRTDKSKKWFNREIASGECNISY